MATYHAIGYISGITVFGGKELEVKFDPDALYAFDEKSESQTIFVKDEEPKDKNEGSSNEANNTSSGEKAVDFKEARIRLSKAVFKLSSSFHCSYMCTNNLLKMKAEKMKVKITCDDDFVITKLEIL